MSGLAILFPGQGAQRVGMGEASAARAPEARRLFERASAVLGYDLQAVCREGPAERLNRTDVCQPALLVSSLADLEALRLDAGLDLAQAGAAAGLSLGEFTALVFAGALGFEDAVRLVALRGEAMQAACDSSAGGMLALIGTTAETAEAVAAEACVVVANYNTAEQFVLSGSRPGIEAARVSAKARGARAIPLRVAGAFHSSLMEPAKERLREALSNVRFAPPRLPVLSNVTGDFYGPGDDPRERLAAQLVSPVQWHPSMKRLVAAGFRTFREVGPGRTLTGMMKGFEGVSVVPSDGGA